MFLDTGWPGMMFHRGHLPDLPARGGPTYARKSWGKRNPMARLGQVAFTLAGREARFAKPERRLSPSILEEWGIDGIIGVQVFAAVASYLYFRAPDEVCFSGPPCISADKLWISTSVGDTALDTFVDTGATRTLIFDGSVRANALVLPGGRAVAAETPTAYVVNHHYGGAIVDGRAAGAVLGWQTLRTLDWDWDLCGGTVKFGRDDSEDSAED